VALRRPRSPDFQFGAGVDRGGGGAITIGPVAMRAARGLLAFPVGLDAASTTEPASAGLTSCGDLRMRFISYRDRHGEGVAVDVNGGYVGLAVGDIGGQLASFLSASADLGKMLTTGPVDLAKVELLPPIPRPGKIVCIGLNYADHSAESGFEAPTYPTVFARYANSLVAHGAPIRDYQFKSPQWTMGKTWDGTGAFGAEFVTADELPPGCIGLKIETRLNGQVVQTASTADMIFDVARLIAILSEVMTLEPGDVIEKIAVLSNPIIQEAG
jgi:acylpyruvate hydrolase